MKFYAIGSREILLAFKLIGVEGTIAETRDEVLDAFNRVTGRGGIANVPAGEIPRVLILTEDAASQIEQEEICIDLASDLNETQIKEILRLPVDEMEVRRRAYILMNKDNKKQATG